MRLTYVKMDETETVDRAFEGFATEYGAELVGLAYLITGDADRAQDAVQEVMLRLLQRGLGDLKNPLAYARRAVVNEVRDTYRRDRTRKGCLARLWEVEAPPNPETLTTNALVIREALAALPERQRAAVVMRFYGDSTDHEIAATLGCAAVTVRVLISRSMKKLRGALGASDV